MKKKRHQRVIPFDTSKTLDQLENTIWGEPTGFVTGLIKECHRLRKIPIENFTIENLRVMIGQQIGLKFLIPLALEELKINPLAEGDFYEGDLLCSVLRVLSDFWRNYGYWQVELEAIVEKATFAIEESRKDMDIMHYNPVEDCIRQYPSGKN
jgi:hypothetical protein